MTPASLLDLWNASRKLLTLVAVLVAAATIYVWWQAAEREKADLLARAEKICAATAGTEKAASFVVARRGDWGVACLERVSTLAQFRSQTINGSLEAAVAALDERAGKDATDAALAAAIAARTNDTLKRMEAADAAVEGDAVGPAWADGINDLGQLRHR